MTNRPYRPYALYSDDEYRPRLRLRVVPLIAIALLSWVVLLVLVLAIGRAVSLAGGGG